MIEGDPKDCAEDAWLELLRLHEKGGNKIEWPKDIYEAFAVAIDHEEDMTDQYKSKESKAAFIRTFVKIKKQNSEAKFLAAFEDKRRIE